MMSEHIQESLCLIFKSYENNFIGEYENAVSSGITTILQQLVDDDERSQGCQGHQRARAFVVDHNLLENSIRLTQKLLKLNLTNCAVGDRLIQLICALLVGIDTEKSLLKDFLLKYVEKGAHFFLKKQANIRY